MTTDIIDQSNCKDKAAILKEFLHLAGNAYRIKSHVVCVNKRQITAALGFFGFVVNVSSFDGATQKDQL